MKVKIAGREVEIETCDDWTWYRVRASLRPHAEVSLVLLRLCWRGPGRPRGSDTPEDVESHAEAVWRDLRARGATPAEIDAVRWAAWKICHEAYDVSVKEAEEAADFSEAPAGSSESS
jgi:hypothetical protein